MWGRGLNMRLARYTRNVSRFVLFEQLLFSKLGCSNIVRTTVHFSGVHVKASWRTDPVGIWLLQLEGALISRINLCTRTRWYTFRTCEVIFQLARSRPVFWPLVRCTWCACAPPCVCCPVFNQPFVSLFSVTGSPAEAKAENARKHARSRPYSGTTAGRRSVSRWIGGWICTIF